MSNDAERIQRELLRLIQDHAGDAVDAVTSDLMNMAVRYGASKDEVDVVAEVTE